MNFNHFSLSKVEDWNQRFENIEKEFFSLYEKYN